VAVWRSDQP